MFWPQKQRLWWAGLGYKSRW